LALVLPCDHRHGLAEPHAARLAAAARTLCRAGPGRAGSRSDVGQESFFKFACAA
jgi:hypothetical protein